MKKSDLKDGMIIEWNDNFCDLGVIIGDSIRYKTGYDRLSILDENLRYKEDYILAIYKVKGKCCSLLSIFEKENLELIWRRPREIDWSKVPKWTKVQVKDWEGEEYKNRYFFRYEKDEDWPFRVFMIKDDEFTGYEHDENDEEIFDLCRIHPSVSIQDEWYKER
ncbi:MAG: hypothetical protein E6343_17585 [Clostridium perfringens]|nr:hypothetical protein [Clostridium perfringens]